MINKSKLERNCGDDIDVDLICHIVQSMRFVIELLQSFILIKNCNAIWNVTAITYTFFSLTIMLREENH